nr:hypothetical protein [uncultured Cohaesibacter sp.]
MTKREIKAIQKALKAKGFYQEAIDGVRGRPRAQRHSLKACGPTMTLSKAIAAKGQGDEHLD